MNNLKCTLVYVEQDFVDTAIAQWAQERPDLDATPLGVVSRILSLYKHLESRADAALADFGLSLWQFDVLAALRRSGPPFRLSPTDLMKSVTLSSGAMTNRIDRLEEAGLVKREPDPSDRRGVLIRLTDRGRELVDRAVAARLDEAREFLAVFDPGEVATLSDLLRKLSLAVSRRRRRRRPAGEPAAAGRTVTAAAGSERGA